MVIELDGRTGVMQAAGSESEWSYTAPEDGHANFAFASASSPDGGAVEIFLNGELIEKVYLTVPHSWWPPTQALGAATYTPGDTLLVRAVGGRVAFRLDLDEFGPEE
jgi:hypothetical protein